ncbi:MAG: class I poly(R)-hydroxyalkanoic acid synthase [Pseudomonadota bacterium]
MTTKEPKISGDAEKLSANIARMEELSTRLVSAAGRKKPIRNSLQGPGQELFAKAAAAYVAEMMENPAKIVEHQVGYWGKALQHYVAAQNNLAHGKLEPVENLIEGDRRFSNPLWDTHPFFNYVKQQYLFSAQAVADAVRDLDHLSERDRKKLDYFSRQIVDMFSPTNFLATNPDALERAVETDGQSLVDGLENLVRDIEGHDGEVVVSLADKEAFRVGQDLGTTPGSVVYRNRLFELIQYTPTTQKVHATPLLIFPPWINKFYILDMKEKNSLIKWVVEQGYTVFVVSWKNPDASYRDVSLDDYIEEGYLTAIEQVKAITQEPKINTVGYCIAGTTLSLTLALLQKRGDTSVKSATFFTTLTDFSDQGEMSVFLDDDFVDGIEEQVKEDGILDTFFMSRTFSYLRSNDLIYRPAIRTYMMGEAPPAFDLLYWNSDGTNLPATMAIQYLRGLCQGNRFADGGIEILGETLRLADVRVPVCAIACETDHIAAWDASYAGIRQMKGRSKTFILSQSGHIAGIVNPPSKNKYGHYTNDTWPETHEEWRDTATFNDGSWWPRWATWLKGRSGRQITAREPGGADHPVLAAAPGSYVLEQPKA